MKFLLAALLASASLALAQAPSYPAQARTQTAALPLQAPPPQSHPPQSHPSWWNWASPDATALVGIRWEALKSSPFADTIQEEWSAPVGLNMPALACLNQAKQFLLSAPVFLAVVYGDFAAAELHSEAAAQSMKPTSYRGVELWISPGRTTMSVARVSDQILLVGLRKTLESAIDRNQPENPADRDRRYSSLLPRAARFSGQELWVVATQLPDPLASGFVPVDVEARGFEGAVNLSDGIRVEATLATGSPDEASALEGRLQRLAPSLPPIARGLQVVQAGDQVVLAMVVSREQLAANLRPGTAVATNAVASTPATTTVAATAPAPAAPLRASVPTAPVATPHVAAPRLEVTQTASAAPVPARVPELAPAPAPVTASIAAPAAATVTTAVNLAPQPEAKPASVPAKPSGPMVIRILGLEGGPREIVFPSAQ